jgi:hypothetical protein
MVAVVLTDRAGVPATNSANLGLVAVLGRDERGGDEKSGENDGAHSVKIGQ